MKRLDGIKACVFDAYGTLFDFASAAARCQDVPDQKLGALTTLWRERQLQYTWLRSLQGDFADFWQVTGDALAFALDSLDIASPELQRQLMDLYLTPAPFPEVPSVLAQLRKAGFRTAILSNGSATMLELGGSRGRPQRSFRRRSVGRCRESLQAPSASLRLRTGKTRPARGRSLIPVIERLGRLRRLSLRTACGLVQPLWPSPGAAAWRTRLPDPDFVGTTRATGATCLDAANFASLRGEALRGRFPA